MDNTYQSFIDIKEWTSTLISRHGHIIIAQATNPSSSKKLVKDYKSQLNKLQKLFFRRKREATNIETKNNYSELYIKVKTLHHHVRQEL